MKKLTWLVAGATLGLAGMYSALSLARWEWSRAIYFGMVFLAAEMAMATGLILRRLRSGAATPSPEVDAEVLARLRATRPARANRFEWLNPVVGRHQCVHHHARGRRPPALGDRLARRSARLAHVNAGW